MKTITRLIIPVLSLTLIASCVSKKKYAESQSSLQRSRNDVAELSTALKFTKEKVEDLEEQLKDCKSQRDQQINQVGDLTVLSKSANDNIKETLEQLESKDEYIKLLQAAKNKTDSMNIALSINLKQQLKEGINDKDINIEVDKTVVMINLSDSMVFRSGSYVLTDRAQEVLGKIATIVESRPDLEVMVEGYTDNVSIKNECIEDNWDLSVKRATSVVRALQNEYDLDPNRLIAAGRGEYNALAKNDTPENRSLNRRTRIIIMPKIDQFYDLLDPDKAPEANSNNE